jgi:hypothetical protein
MNSNSTSSRRTLFKILMGYTHRAAQLGQQARERVFGFGLRSTIHIDRFSLPVRLVNDHHLLQRQHAFHQSGGPHSSIALHALNKARQQQ